MTRHLFLAVLAATAVACGGSGPSDAVPTDLALVTDAHLGSYLVTRAGRTLYYFTDDRPAADGQAAISNCTAGCLTAWPAYAIPANATLGAGLSAADFTDVVRTDGIKQTAYKGWPLYTFYTDDKLGDITGENVDKAWFVIKNPFYSLVLMDKPSLHYLATASGKTIYWANNDTPGNATTTPISACTGGCIVTWPAVAPFDHPVVPTGVDASLIGSFTRPDGAQQATFKGHPLYTFVNDHVPGDTNGTAAAVPRNALGPDAP